MKLPAFPLLAAIETNPKMPDRSLPSLGGGARPEDAEAWSALAALLGDGASPLGTPSSGTSAAAADHQIPANIRTIFHRHAFAPLLEESGAPDEEGSAGAAAFEPSLVVPIPASGPNPLQSDGTPEANHSVDGTLALSTPLPGASWLFAAPHAQAMPHRKDLPTVRMKVHAEFLPANSHPAVTASAVSELAPDHNVPSDGSPAAVPDAPQVTAMSSLSSSPLPGRPAATGIPHRSSLSPALADVAVPGHVFTSAPKFHQMKRTGIPVEQVAVDGSPVAAFPGIPPSPSSAIASFPDALPAKDGVVPPPLDILPRHLGKTVERGNVSFTPETVAAIPAPVFNTPSVIEPVLHPAASPVLLPVSDAAAGAPPVHPAGIAELDTPIPSQPSTVIPDPPVSPRPEIAFAVRLQSSGASIQSPRASVTSEPNTPVRGVRPPDVTGDTRDHSDSQGRGQSGSGESFRRDASQRPDLPATDVAAPTAAPSPQAPPHASIVPVQPNVAPAPRAPAPVDTPPVDPAPIARAASAAPVRPIVEDGAPQPVRELSIRISDGASRAADVRITDRAGEVRVSVRSADPELNASLREGLSGLASQLDRHPVTSEIWRPAVAEPKGTENQSRNQEENRGESHAGQNGESHSGNGGGHTPRRQQPTPDWEEMEPGFGISKSRHTRT